jgi:endopolyphosphatase
MKYYIPDLGSANETHPPKFKLEYLTFDPTALHPQNNETSYHYPVPLRNLPRSLRNTTIVKSKYAPYRMNDLTIPSWVNLARKLAKPKKKKLRKRFKKYMFMGGEEA